MIARGSLLVAAVAQLSTAASTTDDLQQIAESHRRFYRGYSDAAGQVYYPNSR